MYPFNNFQQLNGQFSSRQNYQQIPQSMINNQGFRNTQISATSSRLVIHHCNIISEKAEVISSSELTNLLDEIFNEFANFQDQNQQLTNLKDILVVLLSVRRRTLGSIPQHKFFTLLRKPLIQILQQWNNGSDLTEDQAITFRNITKLLKSLVKEIADVNLYPSWLSDSSLLDTIAVCFTNISKSSKFFDKENEQETKSFISLLNAYDDYQKDLDSEDTSNQDKLVKLLDPIIHCLNSHFYLDSFNQIQTGKESMSKKTKFFLIKCPTFLTSYDGSRLEQTMNNLLSTMLPKYIIILDRLVPLANRWNHATIRAVNQILKIVNHGSTNAKIVSEHLPFIDHVLKIIDVSKFYNNLQNTLSNRATSLINTAVSLLANMINEPTILAHIKQKQVTLLFLRLKSAPYEPIVYNIHTLLAYTTSEEDIKSMQNPGALLTTVVKALNVAVNQKSDNEDEVVQLFETLKGLVQHDQIKEEVLKGNTLSFLLECINMLTGTALTLSLETLWSLSFSQDIAHVLRGDSKLQEKIQTVSKNTNDEALKKATDGLIWKLVQEPAFLNKVAKREQEEAKQVEEESITHEVVIGTDGRKQIVTTKRSSIAQTERVFQYDIMISYCHKDQELIKKIHKFLLDQGFKIWIDLNNMFGPAMDAMAEAVENSEFVLLSMSDSYKQSTYCQAEAEYAFNCKRRLIPLIVRPGYKADGWLGFMIGSRIYIDYGHFDFETACGKLMDEISRQRKRPLPSQTVQSAPVEKQVTTPPVEKKSAEKSTRFSDQLSNKYMKRKVASHFNDIHIDLWTESDVLDFLFSHNLNELMPLCEKMDGPALIQLFKMCTSRHNRTFTILNDQLKTTHKMILPIGTYTRFLSTMEKIIKPSSQQLMLRPPTSQSQQMLIPRPPQLQRMLMPPLPPQPQLMQRPSSQLPLLQDSNSPYDIVITSNAPVSQVLQMVQKMGSHWPLKNSAQL